MKAAEAEIASLQERRSELERAMFDPNSASPADASLSMTEFMKLHSDIGARLEAAEERWLQASKQMEKVEAA